MSAAARLHRWKRACCVGRYCGLPRGNGWSRSPPRGPLVQPGRLWCWVVRVPLSHPGAFVAELVPERRGRCAVGAARCALKTTQMLARARFWLLRATPLLIDLPAMVRAAVTTSPLAPVGNDKLTRAGVCQAGTGRRVAVIGVSLGAASADAGAAQRSRCAGGLDVPHLSRDAVGSDWWAQTYGRHLAHCCYGSCPPGYARFADYVGTGWHSGMRRYRLSDQRTLGMSQAPVCRRMSPKGSSRVEALRVDLRLCSGATSSGCWRFGQCCAYGRQQVGSVERGRAWWGRVERPNCL